MRILRVFPRKTRATPTDELVRFGPPNLLDTAIEADACHVSCAFTWDLSRAEALAKAWAAFFPTSLGGPPTNACPGL